MDEQEVRFCTHLNGKASWFLPFNLGWNDGAGNPPNPNGLKTDYLWKRILTRAGLTDTLENYAQVVETKDMDSYRVEKKAAAKIQLPDSDAEIEPFPTAGGGHRPEPELDRLSNILKVFNDQFGNIRGPTLTACTS